MKLNRILKGFLYTIGGGFLGGGIGYGLILLILLLIFRETLGVGALIVGLTTFMGVIYGIAVGICYFLYPKYVNKFVMIGVLSGLIIGSIISVALDKYREVAIIGLPILFGLIGVFLDKREKTNKEPLDVKEKKEVVSVNKKK